MTKLTLKKILSVILAVVTVIFCVPVSATGEFTEGLYTYTVSDGNATITGVSYYVAGDVAVPDKLGGYTVTGIGDYAFASLLNLASITLPDSVTHIGVSAFYDCSNLTSITLPDSVTHIGDSAFAFCSGLTSIILSDSLTHIGIEAFSGCDSLTSITIPDSVTHIGRGAFAYCSNLTSVTLPNKLTSISDYMFQFCNSLTSITIPDSVTHIGSNTFTFSGLSAITIPDSVTSIAENAFGACYSLVNVTVGSGISAIPSSAFSDCTSLKKIVIPKSVTSITSNAFYNCPSLSEVYYGGSRMDWDNIAIASTNSYLTSANAIHYNCDTANIDSHFAYTVTTEPTCSAEGAAAYVCPCGFSKYEESLPVTDTHINTEIRDAVTPTASADGYSGDTYCTDCGDMIAKGEIIPRLPVSPGDANGDGAINLSDVTLLLQYIAKWDVTLG